MVVATILAIALPAGSARAGNAQQVQNVWVVIDKCRRESFEKFPDQTPDGIQQRDRYVKQCKILRLGANAPVAPSNN
jgi:hypothetical protein